MPDLRLLASTESPSSSPYSHTTTALSLLPIVKSLLPDQSLVPVPPIAESRVNKKPVDAQTLHARMRLILVIRETFAES